MKEYKKILGDNIQLQNQLALAVLLDKGRENLLNDNFFNKMLESVDKKTNGIMTASFQKEFIKIARDMAKMKANDLYEYIKNEVPIVKNKGKER